MVARQEPAPPYAALELHGDRVRAGLATFKPPGKVLRDRFEIAAEWERRAIAAPVDIGVTLARIGRASLTGESPWTRRGRWRRDLRYLEAVAAEAVQMLSGLRSEKYDVMVADWRAREPLNIWRRIKARQAERAAAGRR